MTTDSVEEEDQVSRLIRQFETGSLDGRRIAAHTLASLGAEAAPAVPPLITGLRHPDIALRVTAAHALAGIGRPAVVPLIESLQEDDSDFRQAIIVTLGQIGRPARDAVPVLTAALDDEHLGPAAATALRNIQRSQWRRLLGRCASWGPELSVIAGVVTALGLGMLVLAWLGDAVVSGENPAARAAAGVAFLGACLGAVIGSSRWGVAGAIGGAVLLGLGGALSGLVLGTVLGGMLEPVGKAMSGQVGGR